MNNTLIKQGLAALLVLAFLGCSNSEFTSSTDSSGKGSRSNSDQNESGEVQKALQDQFNELGDAAGSGGAEQAFTANGSMGLTDVFFAFDTSGSMKGEKTFLEANMKLFLEELERQKLDYRVTAIGEGFIFPQGLPANKFAVLPVKVGSHDAIGRLNQVFAGTLPLPLRPGAVTEVIAVTDDEGQGPGNLSADFKGPAGATVVFDSIVGLKVGVDAVNPNCKIENVGQQYINLSNSTKGQVFNLCESLKDFNGVLKKLSQQIVATSRGFKLDKPLDPSKPYLIKVKDKVIDPALVTYDAASNSLILSPDVPIAAGDAVVIRFYVKA